MAKNGCGLLSGFLGIIYQKNILISKCQNGKLWSSERLEKGNREEMLFRWEDMMQSRCENCRKEGLWRDSIWINSLWVWVEFTLTVFKIIFLLKASIIYTFLKFVCFLNPWFASYIRCDCDNNTDEKWYSCVVGNAHVFFGAN